MLVAAGAFQVSFLLMWLAAPTVAAYQLRHVPSHCIAVQRVCGLSSVDAIFEEILGSDHSRAWIHFQALSLLYLYSTPKAGAILSLQELAPSRVLPTILVCCCLACVITSAMLLFPQGTSIADKVGQLAEKLGEWSLANSSVSWQLPG